jgi:hypothetical protein
MHEWNNMIGSSSCSSRLSKTKRSPLQAQEKHLALAQAQLERSNKSIGESIELQRYQ